MNTSVLFNVTWLSFGDELWQTLSKKYTSQNNLRATNTEYTLNVFYSVNAEKISLTDT